MHSLRQRSEPWNLRGRVVEMCKLPIDAEHTPYKRKDSLVFALWAADRDHQHRRADLADASDYRFVRLAKRPEILPSRCQHIDQVRRQASEHAHSQVEAIWSSDSTFVRRATRS